MVFDPVRDAVRNSPVSQLPPLPSPRVPPSSGPTTLSSPTSYFTSSHAWSGSAGPSTSAASQSPTTSRRATDLSVLLNAEEQIPSPTYQRRPSSSSSIVGSPSFGTPRPRSAHLSHILQPNDDDGSPVVPPPAPPSASDSPFGSPVMNYRESSQPTATVSRSRPSTATSGIASTYHPDLPRRASSSSASGTMSAQRSPEIPRAVLSSSPSMSGISLPAKPHPTIQMSYPRPPRRSTVPYAPQHRRTAADSVLKPITDAERNHYKNLNQNPLRTQNKLGKRKFDDVSSDSFTSIMKDDNTMKRSRDVGLVMDHYNHRPDVGVTQRQQSPIIGLKNFNNWVKSVIIARFAHAALHGEDNGRTTRGSDGALPVTSKVLDLGCGKGGDLNKWQKAKIREYVGVDIAAISVDQAKSRYHQSIANPSKGSVRFKAFFASLDCFTKPLTDIPDIPLPPREAPFDVVSMQFCMHYAFENVQKARMMLDNVTRWLRSGGRFIGTIPNDKLLLNELEKLPPNRDPNDLSFGNSVFRVKFDDRERKPIFGHRYSFFLRDAVEDVPEYIVHWDNFEQMASEYHLRLLYKAEFHDVFDRYHRDPEFSALLHRMKVVNEHGESQMDEDQWSAANVYVAFAFEKM